MASLFACSENIEEEQATIPTNIDVVDDLVPVQFSVSDQRVIDFTRASTSIISFDASETVKVFVKPDGASNYTDYDYTTAAAGQSVNLTAPATPPYYPPGASTTVEAYAYYPSTASTSFSVQSDQTSDAAYKLSDLMYADNRTVTKGATDGHDHLAMAHQMAQLAITAQAQAGSGISISRVEVIAKTDVTFDPDPTATNRVTTTGSAGTIIALNGAGTGYVVIPPQIINGVVIKVVTGAGTADLIATYAFTGTGNFESGNSYAIDLSVSPDQLGFTTAINNWNGVGSVNVTPAGNLTISAINAQEYTGSALTPSFTVKKGDETVDPSLYDVTWVNNVNAGKAYIIVAGKGTQEGAVGMASFTITPANGKIEYAVTSVSEPYGTLPFTHPLSNHDTRPGQTGQSADGEVTYVSSDPTVATVNPASGEVTLLKAGTTRITATATNGANYVYSVSQGDNTAYYDLTVTRAPATISFGYPTPTEPWTTGTYTQTVTDTGDATTNGTVTYSVPAINDANNTCGATINSSTGEVTFTKSGSVVVTATVASANTDCYTYSSTTASYTLNVTKIDHPLTLSATSGSVGAGSNATITVYDCHDASLLSAAATAGNTIRVGSISVSGNTITVPTNGITPANVTITVTCAANDNYNAASTTYALEITGSVDIKMNPLWYVAQYNMKTTRNTTPLYMGSTVTEGYFYSWNDAMSMFSNSTTSKMGYYWGNKTISGQSGTWHLPSAYEFNSIIPSCVDPTYTSTDRYVNIPSITSGDGYGALFSSVSLNLCFGYDDTTKGTSGTFMKESSYWYRKNAGEIYAIRYCGTNFCSVWKYKMTGSYSSRNLILTITSKLLGTALTTSEVSTIYGTNESKWTAEFENLDFNSVGVDETNGAVQRQFYGAGDYSSGYSTTASNNADAGMGWYWTATEGCTKNSSTTFTNGNLLYFTGVETMYTSHGTNKSCGFTIRLFRDN